MRQVRFEISTGGVFLQEKIISFDSSGNGDLKDTKCLFENWSVPANAISMQFVDTAKQSKYDNVSKIYFDAKIITYQEALEEGILNGKLAEQMLVEEWYRFLNSDEMKSKKVEKECLSHQQLDEKRKALEKKMIENKGYIVLEIGVGEKIYQTPKVGDKIYDTSAKGVKMTFVRQSSLSM